MIFSQQRQIEKNHPKDFVCQENTECFFSYVHFLLNILLRKNNETTVLQNATYGQGVIRCLLHNIAPTMTINTIILFLLYTGMVSSPYSQSFVQQIAG